MLNVRWRRSLLFLLIILQVTPPGVAPFLILLQGRTGRTSGRHEMIPSASSRITTYSSNSYNHQFPTRALSGLPSPKLEQESILNKNNKKKKTITDQQEKGSKNDNDNNTNKETVVLSSFVSNKPKDAESKTELSWSNKETDESNDTLQLPFGLNMDFANEIPLSTLKPLAILLFSQFILFIGVGAILPTLPLYSKAIGLSASANGLVLSTPALALLIGAKWSGAQADQSRLSAMKWGMLLIAISDAGTALSSSVVPLLVARFGLGSGRCLSESGERGMLADLAGTVPEWRGRILAAQPICYALGIAIGAPLGGQIVEMYGPRASFLCVTAAALVCLGLYFLLPETVEESTTKSELVDNKIPSDKIERKENDKEMEQIAWRKLLEDDRWKGLSLFEIGIKFGYAAKLTSIPIIAASVLPGGAAGAGALISAAGVSGLVGGPLGGTLVDRIGAKNVLLGTGIISAIGLIGIPLSLTLLDDASQITVLGNIPVSRATAFTASVLMWSSAAAAQNPACTALAQELAPEGSEATAMALPRASGDAVYLVAPFGLGLVADLAGVPLGAECAFAGLFGLMGVIALAIL